MMPMERVHLPPVGSWKRLKTQRCAFQNTYPETVSSIKTKPREARSRGRTLRDILFPAGFSLQEQRAIQMSSSCNTQDTSDGAPRGTCSGWARAWACKSVSSVLLLQAAFSTLFCPSQLNRFSMPKLFPVWWFYWWFPVLLLEPSNSLWVARSWRQGLCLPSCLQADPGGTSLCFKG